MKEENEEERREKIRGGRIVTTYNVDEPSVAPVTAVKSDAVESNVDCGRDYVGHVEDDEPRTRHDEDNDEDILCASI